MGRYFRNIAIVLNPILSQETSPIMGLSFFRVATSVSANSLLAVKPSGDGHFHRGEKRIDDCLFSCLNCRGEKRLHADWVEMGGQHHDLCRGGSQRKNPRHPTGSRTGGWTFGLTFTNSSLDSQAICWASA
jgi:hypothetical protein